ncbi:MAG: hypothetical protein K2V38_15820 [Gemmataceae bacterium]|nr:hypothetical protein [Gemmataceae bacterium]
MANYCDCDLYVSGNETDIKTFLEYARGEDEGQPLLLDFRRFIPEPDREDQDWWRSQILERWGTRTNAMDAVIDSGLEEYPQYADGHRAIKFRFFTKWSPPLPVVLSAARRFRALSFTLVYYEAGMAFHGRFTCKAGVPVEDLVADYYGPRGG